MPPPSPDDASPHHRPALRNFIVITTVLFAIVAGFYWMENSGGQRAWDQEKARLAAAGESLDLADFFPDPSSVPEQENGASLSIFTDDSMLDGQFSPWVIFADPPDFFYYVTWYEGNGPEFRAIAEALKNSSTPTDSLTDSECARIVLDGLAVYDASFSAISEVLSRPLFVTSERSYYVTEEFARMATLRALCHIVLGQSEEAKDDIISILQSRRFTPNLTLYSLFTTQILIADELHALWFGLAKGSWKPSDLLAIEAELAAIAPKEMLLRALPRERAVFCSELEFFLADRSLVVDQLYCRGSDVLPYDFGMGWQFNRFATSIMLRFMPTGWFRQNQAFYVTETDRLIRAIASGAYAPPASSTSSSSPYTWLADPTLESLPYQWQIKRHLEAILAQARTAIAIELFRQSSGHLPASLTELSPAPPPDPMTGAPLLYQRVDDSRYKLWSVATNGIDDGGETGTVFARHRALDWVWQSWINEETEKADN